MQDFLFYPQARGSKTSDINASITPSLEDTKSENIGLNKLEFVLLFRMMLGFERGSSVWTKELKIQS